MNDMLKSVTASIPEAKIVNNMLKDYQFIVFMAAITSFMIAETLVAWDEFTQAPDSLDSFYLTNNAKRGDIYCQLQPDGHIQCLKSALVPDDNSNATIFSIDRNNGNLKVGNNNQFCGL